MKPTPNLLSLPAELRNKIWHYALVLPHQVVIAPGCVAPPMEPGLLRVSKQLRSETAGIYYTNHEFSCAIADFDHRAYRWCTHFSPLRHYNGARKEIVLQIPESTNWANLKLWLKHYYEHSAQRFKTTSPKTNAYAYEYSAWQVFRFVDDERDAEWARIEQRLEEERVTMALTEPAWLDE